MKDELLGIGTVLVFTPILFLLRHLILTVGKRKARSSLASGPKAAKKSPCSVDSADEKEREGTHAESASSQVHSRAFPRFPA